MASYGGRVTGFLNNPVEYAFYEWRRGGRTISARRNWWIACLRCH